MTQETIDNIKALDKPGREKFKKLCAKMGYNYFEPENEKLAYDCGFIWKGKKYIVELKDRSPMYECYDELILEQDKAERLIKWKQRLEAHRAYYVNFFGDTVYIFNIDEKVLEKPSKKMWMNAVTAESRTNKIKKDVYLLDKKEARKIIL